MYYVLSCGSCYITNYFKGIDRLAENEKHLLIYEKIEDLPFDIASYSDIDVDIMNNFYWYKMSAYKLIDGDKLEGLRSEPYTWGP